MNTLSKKCLFGGTIIAAGLSAPAVADITVRPVSDGGVLTDIPIETWDLGTLADFGIIGFTGPVGPGGGGPIPGGFFTYSSIDGATYSYNDLVGVGPSAGFGNPANWVGANYFVDSFAINFGGGRSGFEWQGSSLLGGTTYDLYVNGGYLATLNNNVRYIVTSSNNDIFDVRLYDPAGGAEGIWGDAIVYVIPAPGAAALLGLGGLAAVRRRR